MARIADGQAVWETWLEGAEVAKTLRQLKVGQRKNALLGLGWPGLWEVKE